MKKILAVLITLVMCIGTLSVYAAGREFTDVQTSDWFYNDVKTAVELGLVNGRSETTYAPNDNLTYAEAIKLAACMHQLYTTGKIDFAAGDPWYMPYADYCRINKITNKEYNYTENATRAGYMEIFANALPGDGLKAINSVADNSIPDVSSSEDYAGGVYKLYRAGILQGVDAEHNCNPFNNITRAEVAAILTRMMNPEKRVEFTLGEEAKEEEPVVEEPEVEEPEVEEPVVEEPVVEEPKPDPFELVRAPKGTKVGLGEAAVCEVEVKGGVAPYEYQWYYECDGKWNRLQDQSVSGLEGATTERISLTRNVPEVLNVRCVVIDAKKTRLTTGAATITIEDKNALKIVTQPVTTTVKVGEDAKLSVETEGGSENITYQWQWDISGRGGWIKMTDNDSWAGTSTPELTVKSKIAANLPIRCVITDADRNVRIETESVNVIFE